MSPSLQVCVFCSSAPNNSKELIDHIALKYQLDNEYLFKAFHYHNKDLPKMSKIVKILTNVVILISSFAPYDRFSLLRPFLILINK